VPLPVTERITRDSLILPLFHEMTEEQQDRVVAVLRAAAGARGGVPAGAVAAEVRA
jgi:perosamine synthetase